MSPLEAYRSLARCEGSGASSVLLLRLDRFCEVLILDGRRYAVILLDGDDMALARVIGGLCLEVLGCLAGILWVVSSVARLRVTRVVIEEEKVEVDEDEDSWRVPSMPEEYER